jgi:hypothetical protein
VMIHLFGGLELLSSVREPIHPATRKASLLLAALAVLGEKGARREACASCSGPIAESPRLGAAFCRPWPQSDRSRPRNKEWQYRKSRRRILSP